MAISYSGGIYTLSTSGSYTPTDLYNYNSSGITRLNGSRIVYDFGSSQIRIGSGCTFTVDTDDDYGEIMFSDPGWDDSTYKHHIWVQSGGTLNLGNTYSQDILMVAKEAAALSYKDENREWRVDGTLNWYGGIVVGGNLQTYSGASGFIDGYATFYKLPGVEGGSIRASEEDFGYNRCRFFGGAIVPFVKTTNPFKGFTFINTATQPAVGLDNNGVSGAEFMECEDWDVSDSSNVRGFGFWDQRWARYINQASGTDFSVAGNLADNNNNRGLLEVRQSIEFSATAGSGAKFYTVDTNNGNRLAANQIVDNPSYLSNRTYTLIESGGTASYTTDGGVLTGVYWRTTGGLQNINNQFDSRGLYNDKTDVFTWMKLQAGFQPATLDVVMKGTGVLKSSIGQLLDLGATETDYATLSALTGIAGNYSGGTLTVTISENHDWNTIYDWIVSKWQLDNVSAVWANGKQSFVSTSNKISYTGHNLAVLVEAGATVDATGKSITADAGYVINGTFNGVISDLTTFRVPITISPIKAGARLVLRKPNLTYAYDEVLTEDNPVIYYESTVSEVLDVGYFEAGKEYYNASINVTGESPVSLSINLEDDLGLTVSDPLVVSAYPISVVNSSGIYVATYSGDGDEYNLYDYLQYYMRENPDEFFANGRQLCTSDGSKITFNHLRVLMGAGNSELIEWDSDITFDATCNGRVINFHSSGNSHFKFGSKALINGQFVYNRPTLTFLNRVASKFVLNDQCIYHGYGTLELVGGTIETYTDIYNYYNEDFFVDSGTIKNLEADYPRDIYFLGDDTGLIKDLTLDSVQGEEFIVEVFIRIPEIDGIEFLNASIMHRTDQTLGFEWKNVYSEYNVNYSDFSYSANGGNYRNPAELVEISNEYSCTRCLPAIQSADKANQNKGLFVGNRYANFTLINPSGDGIDDGWMYIYDYNNGHRTNAQGWDFTADEPVMVRTQADGTTGVTKVRTWVYHRYLDEVGQGTFDTGSNRLDRRTKYDIEGDRLQPLVREVVVGGYGYVTTPPKEFDFLGRYTLLADIPAGINAGVTEQDKSVVATYTGYTYQFNGAVLELEITEDASINKVYDIVAFIEDQNYQHHVEENNGVHHMYTTNKVDYTYNNFVLTVNGCKVQGNGTQVLPVKPTVLNGGFYRDAEDVRFDVAGQLHLARYFNAHLVTTEDSSNIEGVALGYGDKTTQTQLMFDLNLNRTGIETDVNGRAEGYLVYNDGTAYDDLKMVFTEYNRQGVIVPRNASGLPIGSTTLPEVTRLAIDPEVTLTKSAALALTDIDITHFPDIRVNFGQHTNSEVYDYVKAKQSAIDDIEPGISGCMSVCLFGQLWKKTGDVYTGLANGFYAEIETGGTIQTGTYIMPVSETFDCNIGTATFEFTEVGTYDYRNNVITGVLTLTNTSGGNVLVKLKPGVVYLPDPLPSNITVENKINITISKTVPAGALVRLGNKTKGTRIHYQQVAGTNYTFSTDVGEGLDIEIGDILEIWVAGQSGTDYTVHAQEEQQITGTNINFTGEVPIWTAASALKIDGSTVIDYVLDFDHFQIDIDDDDLNFYPAEAIAYVSHMVANDIQSMETYFRAYSDITEGLWYFPIIKFDNLDYRTVKARGSVLIVDDTGEPPTVNPTTGGGGITMTAPFDVKSILENIEFKVDTVKINGARVIGDGSEADKWRSENV
jgi:hypothetical protein